MIARFSYALGLILLVPLGDLFERRGLIVLMTLLSSGGLLLSAFAPNIQMLMLGTAATGLAPSVQAQVLVPSAILAAPHERGRRRRHGHERPCRRYPAGPHSGRRAGGPSGRCQGTVLVAAILMLAMSCALWKVIRATRSHSRHELSAPARPDLPPVRRRTAAAAVRCWARLLFAAFSMLWTPLTFLLSGPTTASTTPRSACSGWPARLAPMPPTASAAWPTAAWATRPPARPAVAAGLLGADGLGQASVIALLAGIPIQDLAIQGVHVTNTSSLYRTRPEARSRLTAGYMTSYFIGASHRIAGIVLAVLGDYGWPGGHRGRGSGAVTLAYGMLGQRLHP